MFLGLSAPVARGRGGRRFGGFWRYDFGGDLAAIAEHPFLKDLKGGRPTPGVLELKRNR